jgi:hypothetical protein
LKEDSDVANKLKRIAIGLMALSMRLDAYAMHKGLTMDAAHPKDPDPKNWRTINGSKVHLTEGKIDGGAGEKFTGKEWTGKTKHEFTPKEKPKPAPKKKGTEAEKLMSYINEQVGVDLSEHRNTKREKRGEVIVKWDDLTRNQQSSIKALANKHGRFELVECGGWGMQLKPKKEEVATREKTVATVAKTTEQAEQDAQKFVKAGFSPTFKGQVSYKGLSSENANEVNQALSDIFDMVNIPGISGIKAISPTSAQGKKAFKDGADAIASYNPVEHGIFLNKELLKDASAFQKHQERARDAWNLVMHNIDKLQGTQKELALKYKSAGRSLVDDSLKGAIYHEIGHHVGWSFLDAKTNNAIGARMSEFAPKLSGYANASKSEYLAESFVAYMKGEHDKIDPLFKQALDKVLK